MLIGYKPGADEPTVLDEVEGWAIHYRYEHKPITSVLEIMTMRRRRWLMHCGKAAMSRSKASPSTFNKAMLRPYAAPALGQCDAKLSIEIDGFTDSTGLPACNQKLPADRAAAVKKWPVARDIDVARLATAGLGDTKPAEDNATEEGGAKNRRVELVRQ